MKTELVFSVIYLADETNDINNFDFFVRMLPRENVNFIAVSVVPRFSLNNKLVKHLNFTVEAERQLSSYDVLTILAQLKELENIVKDISLGTDEAEEKLKGLMISKIKMFNKG